MTTSAYFHHPKKPRHLHQGPLAGHLDLFAARLLKEGHCQQSGWRNLRVAGDYSRWLARKGLQMRDVSEHTVEQYHRFRQRHRHPYCSDRPALQRFLRVLREFDLIPHPRPSCRTEHEQIEDEFNAYLFQERGFRQVSIIRHIPAHEDTEADPSYNHPQNVTKYLNSPGLSLARRNGANVCEDFESSTMLVPLGRAAVFAGLYMQRLNICAAFAA